MTQESSKHITMFTFVKTADGYTKRQITLHELLARLSDKAASDRALEQTKNHSRE